MSANLSGRRLGASAALLLISVLLAGCAAGGAQIWSGRTRADHKALATWYEQEAKSANEKAEKHRRMLDDTYRPAYGSPYTGIYRDPGFIRHCEKLVRQYELIAEDSLALATLHRQAAADARE